MGKAKVSDLTRAYRRLAPERDYPPDRLDPSYKN
jgi:hypothetical protein